MRQRSILYNVLSRHNKQIMMPTSAVQVSKTLLHVVLIKRRTLVCRSSSICVN